MTFAEQTRFYFSNLTSQIPMLLALLVTIIVLIVKWQDGSRGSLWALLGLLVALGGALLSPIGYIVIENWARTHGLAYSKISTIYTINNVFWAVVRAASLIFLTIAVFAGRPGVPAR